MKFRLTYKVKLVESYVAEKISTEILIHHSYRANGLYLTKSTRLEMKNLKATEPLIY